jgi:hypothetical protein
MSNTRDPDGHAETVLAKVLSVALSHDRIAEALNTLLQGAERLRATQACTRCLGTLLKQLPLPALESMGKKVFELHSD